MIRYKESKVYHILQKGGLFLIGMTVAANLSGCGNQANNSNSETLDKKDISTELQKMSGMNPDIFGWLYVPGTNISYPIAQNVDGDDSYYVTHDVTGLNESDKGGIYIESFNMMDMCDFNTVIHGKTTSDGDMFSELWNFAKEDYFKEHDQFYIFLQDNTLTYEIYTAYQAPNEDIFREYDMTDLSSCQQYIDDMKKYWTTKTNFREGWDGGVDSTNFLVTLSTVDAAHPDKQWIVVGCLVGDKAGTINRELGDETSENPVTTDDAPVLPSDDTEDTGNAPVLPSDEATSDEGSSGN